MNVCGLAIYINMKKTTKNIPHGIAPHIPIDELEVKAHIRGTAESIRDIIGDVRKKSSRIDSPAQ